MGLLISASPILPSFSSRQPVLEEAAAHPLVEEGGQLRLAGVEARSRPKAEEEEHVQAAGEGAE